MSTQNRAIHLDLIKALAIFLVCYYHSESMIANARGVAASVDLGLPYFWHALATIAVPLFFMVNGALVLNRPIHLSTHLKKTLKLFALSIGWGFILMISVMWIQGERITVLALLEGVHKLKLGYTNHLWFLKALILVYLLLPIIKHVYDDPNGQRLIHYFLGILFIFSFLELFLNQLLDVGRFLSGIRPHGDGNVLFFRDINPFGNKFYAILYFIVGALLIKNKNSWADRTSNTKWLLAFIIGWITLYGYGLLKTSLSDQPFDAVYFCYFSVMTLIMSVSAFQLMRRVDIQNDAMKQAIQTISSNTLGIYLIHHIINVAVIAKPNPVSAYLKNGGVLVCALYATVLLIASLLIAVLLKRTPILRNTVII